MINFNLQKGNISNVYNLNFHKHYYKKSEIIFHKILKKKKIFKKFLSFTKNFCLLQKFFGKKFYVKKT